MYDRPTFRPDPSLEEITPAHPSSSPPQHVPHTPTPTGRSGVGIAWFISVVAVILVIAVAIYSISLWAGTHTQLNASNTETGTGITPTPEITPVPPTQENTFAAGQTWKGSSLGCGCADDGQGILKIATINPDGSFAGSFEHIAPNFPSDDTYSITGTIVHNFSDPNWQIIFRQDGMETNIPGIWSIFPIDNYESNGNFIFYMVARENGHIDGYALRDDGDGNIWLEIHLDKTSP